MGKKELKELLKRRDELLYMHHQLNNSSKETPSDINTIYKSGRNNIDCIIYDIDMQLIKYVKQSPVGNWLLQINGISTDIAAGLLIYFDITNKDCAAQFIRFAGIDNKNIPHNSTVHDMMDKIITNFKSDKDSLYGKLNIDKFNELSNKGLNQNVAELRSDRYMMKVFLSHLFEEMYREEHDGKLPKRYECNDNMIIEPEVPYTK